MGRIASTQNSCPPRTSRHGTLFRIRLFTDVTKVRVEMSPYLIRVGPASDENVLMRGRKEGGPETRRRRWDRGDVSTSWGTPRIDNIHCRLEGRQGTVYPSEPPEITNPDGSLILDWGPPKLWESKFLLFWARKFVLICFGTLRKQIQVICPFFVQEK